MRTSRRWPSITADHSDRLCAGNFSQCNERGLLEMINGVEKKRMGRPREGKMVTCKVCGKEVYRSPSLVSRTYCSLECRDKAVRAKRVNESEGTAKCAKCGEWKPLSEFVKGIKGRPHSYCLICSRKWFEDRRRKNGMKPWKPADEASKQRRKLYKREYNRIAHHDRRAAGKMPGKYDIGRMLCEQDARCAYCGELLSNGYHIDHKLPVCHGGRNDIENLHLTCARCNLRKGTMTHEEFLVSKRRRPYRQAGPLGKLP